MDNIKQKSGIDFNIIWRDFQDIMCEVQDCGTRIETMRIEECGMRMCYQYSTAIHRILYFTKQDLTHGRNTRLQYLVQKQQNSEHIDPF
jgi:hypothetical protein